MVGSTITIVQFEQSYQSSAELETFSSDSNRYQQWDTQNNQIISSVCIITLDS